MCIKERRGKKVVKKIKLMYKNVGWYMERGMMKGRSGEFGCGCMIEFDNGWLIEWIGRCWEGGGWECVCVVVIDEGGMVGWGWGIWGGGLGRVWRGGWGMMNCSG